jgi:pyruvate/2-oxoglutarate/acetoin dehydrogenase E1 component
VENRTPDRHPGGPQTCGFAAELLAEVQGEPSPAAKRRCSGSPDSTPFPYALEDHYLPNKDRVLDVLKKTIEF